MLTVSYANDGQAGVCWGPKLQDLYRDSLYSRVYGVWTIDMKRWYVIPVRPFRGNSEPHLIFQLCSLNLVSLPSCAIYIWVELITREPPSCCSRLLSVSFSYIHRYCNHLTELEGKRWLFFA